MTKRLDVPRLQTGVRNLDEIMNGGLPKGSLTIVSGAPGSGKTILSQQIAFHNASARNRVLCFSTLSEPPAKTLRHLREFSFFDAKKVRESIQFVDLGAVLRSKGLEGASELILQHVKKVKPAILIIDSFKVFDDLATSKEERRKFGYQIAVNLMAWEITALFLGEYGPADYDANSLFAIVDGLIVLSQRESLGENQRFLKIIKMRGTDHSRDENPFVVSANGVEIYAARTAIKREDPRSPTQQRCRTHITKLDEILGPGIPWGSSLLIGGVAGTGKTVLSLEFIYRGALKGEKGILFSFEETEERLRAAAEGLGWNLGHEIDRGMVEIVFIPQPDINVEAHLLMLKERIEAMKAKRVVIDSISVFLHKITSPQLSREKVFHLCSLVQNAQAVGFFPTDIPYGSQQVSRFGVEETVVDGVIILSSTEEKLERERYIEVYKLRNTAHLKGRHNMVIGYGGVSVFPRYADEPRPGEPPPALVSTRLGSGVPGLDEVTGGGFLKRSATLVSGSAGIGKTVFGLQFLLEGASKRQRGLYVTLEEGPEQLLASADALGLPLRAMVDAGLIDILYIARERVRAGQFLTVLGDRLTALKASRVVLDAATQMLSELMLEDVRHILYKLVVRFKALGITSLFTLEAPALLSTERVTDLGLSPIADNLLMLRYTDTAGRLVPMLTIVKTRGSDHGRATFPITFARGGMSIGPALGDRRGPARAAACRQEGCAEEKPPKAKMSSSTAHLRLEQLYDISKLFARFENVEQTFDPVLVIVASTLPLRSAILIETNDDGSRMIVWLSQGQRSEQAQAAKEHAEAAYAYLVGAASTEFLHLSEQGGFTQLPTQPGTEGNPAKRFIVIPLVVAHRPLFGVLQLEGAQSIGKTDLIFINAIANQLAIALDRDRAWRRDIRRREHAEQERTDAEARGAAAERQRTIAEESRLKYQALADENARLYERAQQAVRAREQILAIVSHDLRNPLSTIALTSAALARRGAPDEGLPYAAGKIQRAAQRMLRLIEDLLDFASIEAGRLAIKRQPQDPGPMVLETLASFENVAQEKRLQMAATVEPDLPKIDCDRDRILQLLANLVGNATKVLAEGGHISVRVDARGHEVWFAVSDDGPGISEQEAAHVFERYWRSPAAGYAGTGLGLAIARGIVSAHGGRIWVESEPGHGATFVFTIPADSADVGASLVSGGATP